jgi:hypothetical protein
MKAMRSLLVTFANVLKASLTDRHPFPLVSPNILTDERDSSPFSIVITRIALLLQGQATGVSCGAPSGISLEQSSLRERFDVLNLAPSQNVPVNYTVRSSGKATCVGPSHPQAYQLRLWRTNKT